MSSAPRAQKLYVAIISRGPILEKRPHGAQEAWSLRGVSEKLRTRFSGVFTSDHLSDVLSYLVSITLMMETRLELSRKIRLV